MQTDADLPDLVRGTSPLIVSIPHSGTEIPADIEARLRDPWIARKDCDWHVDRLYEFAPDLGATVVRMRMSRTVIDVNRDPGGASLYPGKATTALCPIDTFDGEPIYLDSAEPDAEEIAYRKARWFRPYHDTLQDAVDLALRRHGVAVVFEAHSIRSVVPTLFEGVLPAINIGTVDGTSCAPELEAELSRIAGASGFSHVVNGRFKGGWTTRHLGRPGSRVHTVQIELADRTYMDEPEDVTPATWPPPWNAARAAVLRPVLERMLLACLAFAKDQT